MLSNLSDLARFVEVQWYRRSGLAAASIAVLLAILAIAVSSKTSLINTAILCFSIELILIGFWYYSRSIPKTPKGKVGFIVSLICSDDSESKKLREDFIQPLRQLIRSGKTGSIFHFIDLPIHIADQIIDLNDAQDLRVKTRSHFILYGKVRLRTINNEELHIIDLEGLVTHKATSEDISNYLSNEFAELLPRRVNISTENDLIGFQFTSEWTDIVARYIIGIAAAISADLDYAEDLYAEVLQRLSNKGRRFPVYAKISERIPIRISELYEARAAWVHRIWVEDRSPEHIAQLSEYVKRIHKSRYHLQGTVYLMAISAFLSDRDTEQAIRFLCQSEDRNNCTWNLNMAFLFGYSGNLRKAMSFYNRATRYNVDPDILNQVESFMCWVVETEPNNHHVYFCLGVFNNKLKGDSLQAKSDFNKFIELNTDGLYEKEIKLVHKWLTKLN